MNKLKVGILGAGGMGQTHFKNLLKMDEVVIVSVCDKDINKANELASKGTDVKAYNNFDNMLLENELDVLFVGLPPFAHSGEVEKAANKGIHLFLEKPIAINTNVAYSMKKAINDNGVISQIGFHNRYGSAVKKLKAMINDGSAGKAVLFDGIFATNSLHSPWWIQKDKCGGQVFEQAIHIYDMAMNLLGTPQRLTGFTGNICHTNVENYTIEDVSAATVRFNTGAIASVCATNCAIPNDGIVNYLAVFENVTVKFIDCNNAEFIYTNGEVTKENFSEDTDVYYDEVRSFIDSIISGRDTDCNIECGYDSFLVVESVVKSATLDGEVVVL